MRARVLRDLADTCWSGRMHVVCIPHWDVTCCCHRAAVVLRTVLGVRLSALTGSQLYLWLQHAKHSKEGLAGQCCESTARAANGTLTR